MTTKSDPWIKKFTSNTHYRLVPNDLAYRAQGSFLINKNYPQAKDLFAKFSASFQELENNGTLKAIRDSYPLD